MAFDPDYAKVALLLHLDGASDSTAMVDSSPAARTVAALGAAKLSTAQKVFGSASLSLSGSSSLQVTSLLGGLDTSKATFEMWLYRTQADVTHALVGLLDSGVTRWSFFVRGFNNCLSIYNDSNYTFLSAANPVPMNQWVHAAFVKDGTSFSIYMGGVLQAQATIATAITPTGIYNGQNGFGLEFYQG